MVSLIEILLIDMDLYYFFKGFAHEMRIVV